MSELFADIGWKSINHQEEELCGDHVEIAENEDAKVLVLADGLGSGVKASILSTLTSKIISTMMAGGLSLEDCVESIVAALPVDKTHQVAYSTFTIIRITHGREAEIIQYDNPRVIMLRGSSDYALPQTSLSIAGKTVQKSTVRLREGDVIVAMSDGCTNASPVPTYNYQWNVGEITDYLKIFAPVGYSAKTLATMLADECYRRYGEHPLDDATACVIRIRPRKRANFLFGPPSRPEDDHLLLDAYLGAEGMHIVCGGTSAQLVSRCTGAPIVPLHSPAKSDIPPMSYMQGIDLVTEGVITMHRVVEYITDSMAGNERYAEWANGRDGASQITRILLEQGTDFHFYVGRAINPAYQSPDLPIDLHLKTTIIEQIARLLRQLDKEVIINYY